MTRAPGSPGLTTAQPLPRQPKPAPALPVADCSSRPSPAHINPYRRRPSSPSRPKPSPPALAPISSSPTTQPSAEHATPRHVIAALVATDIPQRPQPGRVLPTHRRRACPPVPPQPYPARCAPPPTHPTKPILFASRQARPHHTIADDPALPLSGRARSALIQPALHIPNPPIADNPSRLRPAQICSAQSFTDLPCQPPSGQYQPPPTSHASPTPPYPALRRLPTPTPPPGHPRPPVPARSIADYPSRTEPCPSNPSRPGPPPTALATPPLPSPPLTTADNAEERSNARSL